MSRSDEARASCCPGATLCKEKRIVSEVVSQCTETSDVLPVEP